MVFRAGGGGWSGSLILLGSEGTRMWFEKQGQMQGRLLITNSLGDFEAAPPHSRPP